MEVVIFMAAKKMCDPCSKAVDKVKRFRGMEPTDVKNAIIEKLEAGDQ